MITSPTPPQLPHAAGVGYKADHFDQIMAAPGPVKWLEIHAENYLGAGGRPKAQLIALRDRFALSVHGVGLSIGGDRPLDQTHLAQVKALCDWVQPAAFSEHLAWSTHEDGFLNDLLPLPYNRTTLAQVCTHIDQVQDTLGRQMMLENPSSYMAFSTSTWSEPDFIGEIVRRTGCALLFDVNNVFVSAANLGFNPQAYIEAYPLKYVREIHLAGHHEDNSHDATLLIDSHSAPVCAQVWALLDQVLHYTGAQPVLIERDNDIPAWPSLRAEAQKAQNALAQHMRVPA